MTEQQIDDYGRIYIKPEDVFELFYMGTLPENILTDTNHPDIKQYNDLCTEFDKQDEYLQQYVSKLNLTPQEEKDERVSEWHIDEKHATLDMRKLLLDLCNTEKEKERVNMEMNMFEERKLIPLLRMMYSLVLKFRKQGIVWGCGRGSSVASYVLFLLGVHKIDSIKYKLDIKEFLK